MRVVCSPLSTPPPLPASIRDVSLSRSKQETTPVSQLALSAPRSSELTRAHWAHREGGGRSSNKPFRTE